MTKKTYSFEKFYENRREALRLTLKTGLDTLKGELYNPIVHRPGLALTGFLERFEPDRVMIIGKTEYAYLDSLESAQRKESLDRLLAFTVPCFIYSKAMEPFAEHVELCNEHQVPIFTSELTTQVLFSDLRHILEIYFAQRIRKHATLVDVFGIGLLLMGQSGVGKSECALDLVERGHRLVADDIVVIHRESGFLIGQQEEPIGHMMEIHGIGFVDVERLFGVRATRLRKRIEVIINLETWQSNKFYNRTGLDKEYMEILEVKIPKITIPVNPGKNIAVISEVIALDHMLKDRYYDVAEEFNKKITDYLKNKNQFNKTDPKIGDTE